MKQNPLAIILGFLSGGGAELLKQTWVTAIIMAIVGATVGWFVTLFLNNCKSRYLKHKAKRLKK